MIEIKIMLIFLLISLLTNTLKGIDYSKLYCGLTAYCGPVPADVNKLKIIAMENEERGRDSCGIFSGGILQYGVDDTKDEEVTTWLQENEIPINPEWRTVIIHNRAATYGLKTRYNAHPFEYRKGERKMWFAHNGTISNFRELCKIHNVDDKDIYVDSKAIGQIIFNEKKCDVFSEYKGAGSFIFCDTKEKNTLWVYKGAAGNKEERPLFFLQDSEGGMYISSKTKPLFLIADKSKGEQIKSFPQNYLCKITNGNIVETFYFPRKENLHQNFFPPSTTTQTSQESTGQPHSNSGHYQKKKRKQLGTGTSVTTQNITAGTKYRFTSNLTKEEITEFYFPTTITFQFIEGRFFRNGHIIDGQCDLPAGETAWFFNGMMVSENDYIKFTHLEKSLRSKEITRWLLEGALLFPTCFKEVDYTPFYLYKKGYMRNIWAGVATKTYYAIPGSESELIFAPDTPVLIGINFKEDDDIVEKIANLKDDIKWTLVGLKQSITDLNNDYEKLKGTDDELKEIWEVVKTLGSIMNSKTVNDYESKYSGAQANGN